MRKRVLVIDDDNRLYKQLLDTIKELKLDPDKISYSENFELESLQNIDILLINIDFVKDLSKFMEIVAEKNLEKIIFITNNLSEKKAHLAVLSGATVHYRFSTVMALIQKIYGKELHELKEQELSKVASQLNNTQICIYSPSGGTGKTTMAINMALELAMRNMKILLVDFSQIGDIRAKLNIIEQDKGLSRLLTEIEHKGSKAVEKFHVNTLNENIYRYGFMKNKHYVDILFSANFVNMEKMSVKDVEVIINQIEKLDYDVVIYDTSSEVSERNLALFDYVDKIIVLASPSIASGWKLLQTKDLFSNIGLNTKSSLLVNKYSKYAGFSCKELEVELQYPLAGIVKEYKDILYYENKSEPYILAEKRKFRKTIGEINKQLFGNLKATPANKKKTNRKFFLKGFAKNES